MLIILAYSIKLMDCTIFCLVQNRQHLYSDVSFVQDKELSCHVNDGLSVSMIGDHDAYKVDRYAISSTQ